MKTATYFTLIAVLFLCLGSQTLNAEGMNPSNPKASSKRVSVFFNSTTKMIELKMFGENRMERVSVQLFDHNKVAVYNETFVVNTNGVTVDIPIEIYGPGIFKFWVKGVSFSFRNTYKFE